MTSLTVETEELIEKLKLEFIEGLNFVLKLKHITTDPKNNSLQDKIECLEEVSINIQRLVMKFKNFVLRDSKDVKQKKVTEKLLVPLCRDTTQSPIIHKQLDFILKLQIAGIKKEIKLEEAKIQYILKKINDFSTLDIYIVWELNDGVQTIDASALTAYKSNKSSTHRSIELMRQLTDTTLKSDYYQVLNNPQSSLEEKNKAVVEAYSKFGNSESLDYREKMAGDEDYWVEVEKGGDFIGMEYTMCLEKEKLSKHWQRLDQVSRFHFRNLKPAPSTATSKKPSEGPKDRKETYLTDVNHSIYEITSLKKLLQAKRDYVQYLVQKGQAFLNREVNYGSSGRNYIRKKFIPIPGEDLGESDWNEYGVMSIGDICYDDSNFVKRYFDFISV